MSRNRDNKGTSKAKKWRNILDQLLEESDKDLKWLCDYIGAAYNENGVSFYEKLPKKRSTYIGIGMAFHQPLNIINSWIADYSAKRKLYIKDITEDLVWIYLIKLNCDKSDSEINYFQRYEDCQSVAFAAYSEVWNEVLFGSLNTADVEVNLDKAEHDDEFTGLTKFIIDNIDSFKTAYNKPRKYIDDYIRVVFRVESNVSDNNFRSLNSMRGFLDDSMINFLSGDPTTINTYDRTKKRRTVNIKYIPRNRKFHISLCLALGMNVSEVNHYLDLMGFSHLSDEDKTEKMLKRLLIEWENTHPLLRAYKDALFSNYTAKAKKLNINAPENYSAFQEELLFLRKELYNRFKIENMTFPYMDS